jgi:WD40 repeat protein
MTWLRWVDKPEQARADLATLAGHLGAVTCCAFFPDGSRLVSGSEDGTLRIWLTGTGLEVARLVSSTKAWEGVLCCAVSPDGRLIASGSADQALSLWDAETGALLRRLRGHGSWVKDCCFFPDGNRIVSASSDGTLRVWGVSSGSEIARLEGHEEEVHGCAVSADGSLIASASVDQTVRLWDAGTGREIRIITGHDDEVTACVFSPDGGRILTASEDKTLRLWRVADGEEISRFEGHAWSIDDCAFSPDGSLILGVEGWRALLWDVTSGAVVAKFRSHSDGLLTACAFSPGGDVIATASKDKSIILWDATMREEKTEDAERTTVREWKIVPDKELAPQEKRTRFWRSQSGSMVSIKCSPDGIEHWTFSPDGILLITACTDGLLRVWETGTGDLVTELKGHTDAVRRCDFSPDGRTIVSGSADKTLRLWDSRRKKEIGRLEGHKQRIELCIFSPDGTRLLSCAGDHELRLWDPSRRALVALLSSPEWRAQFAAFGPDGRRVYGLTEAGKLRVWDALTGDELRAIYEQWEDRGLREGGVDPSEWRSFLEYEKRLSHGREEAGFKAQAAPRPEESVEGIHLGKGLSLNVSSFILSPSGARFALGTEKGEINVWDALDYKRIFILQGPRSSIGPGQFSPDERYLLTGSNDGSVVIWELAGGGEVAQIPLSGPMTGLHWSPDERNIAVFARDAFSLLKCENLPTAAPGGTEHPPPRRRHLWSRR